jgi:hypothetical protein
MTAPTPAAPGQAGAMALTIAMWLLLADAAVETFLSGATLRWWVAGVVALFLFLTAHDVWHGPRPSAEWRLRASAAFFVLLGLLALTAWLPDGLIDGIRILGQPTAVVLSGLSAVAVAAAGVELLRVRFFASWAKAVFGVLAAYGVASFVNAALTGTPYSAALSGDGFWLPLPGLQGALIGSIVIVPLGAVAGALESLRRQRMDGRQAWAIQQTIALVLCTVIATSGFVLRAAPALAQRRPDNSADSAIGTIAPVRNSYAEMRRALSTARDSSPSAEHTAAQFEQILASLQKNSGRLPRATFDPDAIVTEVGRNPVALFEWVRDRTSFVPYRGVLRGDRGVLMDRLGNSLDRALLLASLVRRAGHEARLAQATLSEDRAAALIEVIRDLPASRLFDDGPYSDVQVESVLARYADSSPTDGPTVRDRVTQMMEQRREMLDHTVTRIEKQARAIVDGIGTPGRKPMESETSLQLEAVRDHWWVQWYDGSTWVDLDPLPGARAGVPFTAFHRTVLPDALDSELHHQVEVRVIIEQWSDGKLTERSPLRHTLRAHESLGAAIKLVHSPADWPRRDPFQETDVAETIAAAVLSQDEWTPVLLIESKAVTESSFTTTGKLIDKPSGTILGGAQIGGLADMLGSGRIGAAPGRNPANTFLTAEWIEYEVRSPGRPAERIRRELFDLVGPAARATGRVTQAPNDRTAQLTRGLTLLGETDILLVGARLSPEFVTHTFTEAVLRNGDVVTRSIRAVGGAPEASNPSTPPPFASLPLLSLALARHAFSPVRTETYLDRPNILAQHRQVRARGAGELVVSGGFDIVANAVAVRPSAAKEAFRVRVHQGVADTVAEALLAAAMCSRAGGPGACGEIANTSEIYAASMAEGIAWKTQRPGDSAPASRYLPADVQARLAAALREGDAVIAPERLDQSSAAWWRVDPASGTTLGVGPRGWGQTASEYVMLVTLGGISVVGVIACGVELNSGGHDKTKLSSTAAKGFCIASIVCLALPLLLLLVPIYGLLLLLVFFPAAVIAAPAAAGVWLSVCGSLATLGGAAETFGW